MQKPSRCSRHGLGTGLFALLLAVVGAAAFAATDAKSLSAQLSDEAFALLNSVSASRDTPNPLLGPVGVFAADSQKLSSALQGGDRRAAHAAMAALKSDAADIDKAAGSGRLDAAKWSAIKHNLAALSASVPAAPASAAAASSEGLGPPAAAPSLHGMRPSVRVESAQIAGVNLLRIKGYMSGTALRSAGIYVGQSRLAKLNVKRAPGEQTIRFDLQIEHPVQGAVLRVYDSAGRSAQASIMGDAGGGGPIVESGPPVAPSAPPSLDSDDNVALGGDDPGSESSAPPAETAESNPPESSPSEVEATGDNTKEIPAATPPVSGPKSRMLSNLRSRGSDDVRIRIDDISALAPGTGKYMVRGQIVGSGLKRAGIYVDGRLAHSIPLNSGPGLHASNFAQSFIAAGTEATIRVYRTRHDYTESSLNLATATTANSAATSPLVINSTIGGSGAFGGGLNPGQLAVQITSVQPAAPSLYVVSGIITGSHIASAGIYQNGVLAQPLSISGGGLSG